jgi:steroid 5-alpha reductase family enzyme
MARPFGRGHLIMTEYILYSTLAIFITMTGLFFIALARKDNSLADIGWGLGFILVTALSFWLEPGSAFRHILVNVLVLAWGIRLAVYILVRSRKRGEDFRYAKWRREWGKGFVLRSYLQVFMLQGLILLFIATPIMLVNHSPEKGATPLDFCGLAVWLLGFFFETVGDYQLLRFKRDPANQGKIITTGLWKTTRHPNYFGEATMWWGLFLIALSVKSGWTGIISPAIITFMLLRVSGVTMLEKKYAGNQEFAVYARKTSAFFPWFPKK